MALPPPTANRISPSGPRRSTSISPAPLPPQSQSLVVTAIGRNKLIVLLLAAVLAAGGIAAGLQRKPTWTAISTLEIGANINPNSPGYAGFVQSETSLATTFSREITSNGVLAIVHAKTRLSAAAAAARISATPVPDGAAFEVIASGPTARAAIKLANVAASAMVSHESSGNFAGDAPAIYKAYRAQSNVLARARARVQQIQSNIDRANSAIPNAGHVVHPGLVQANADVDAAQARANALQAAYTQALEAQPLPSGNLVTRLSSALTASSDRVHKIELFGFVGLAAGLLLGAAIGILREQRRPRSISPQ